MNRSMGGGGGGGGGDGYHRDRHSRRGGGGGGGRSPPRSRGHRRRSRSRDNRRHSNNNGAGNRAEEQQRLRDMLLSEAAKKNPDAASVLQSAGADQEALQRALATASTLSASQHQQQQQQQQNQQASGSRQPSHNARQQQGRIPEQEKIYLELHIGGLPDQVQDEVEFTRFLNEVALQKNINLEPGNPVLSCRINHANHFAFALFRSKEEATRGLEMSGMTYYGNTLRVDRPRAYKELHGTQQQQRNSSAPPQMDEQQMIATVMSATPLPIIPGVSREQLKQRLEDSIAKHGDPSSVIQLSNLEGAEVSEVDAEARKYGAVTAVRPVPENPGTFFVKMASIQDAEKLVQIKRAYRNLRVEASFRPLAEWTAMQNAQ